MAFGQIAAAALVDRALRTDLPLGWIAVAPCLEALTNLWLSRREDAAESALIGWLFVLDTLGLTAVLMLTGGPTNPLSLLYLVYITLSAMILNQRQTWALGLLASICFALLFWRYRPIPALECTITAKASMYTCSACGWGSASLPFWLPCFQGVYPACCGSTSARSF